VRITRSAAASTGGRQSARTDGRVPVVMPVVAQAGSSSVEAAEPRKARRSMAKT
jgi:hypothetical protein